jgi:hypothetical protein
MPAPVENSYVPLELLRLLGESATPGSPSPAVRALGFGEDFEEPFPNRRPTR